MGGEGGGEGGGGGVLVGLVVHVHLLRSSVSLGPQSLLCSLHTQLHTSKSKSELPGQLKLMSRHKHSQMLLSNLFFGGHVCSAGPGHLHSHDGGTAIWNSPSHLVSWQGPFSSGTGCSGPVFTPFCL